MIKILDKIIANAIFNNVLSEKITYNDHLIDGIAEIGTNNQPLPNSFIGKGNGKVIGGAGFFTIKLEDVPVPKKFDRIKYRGQTYNVADVEVMDYLSGTAIVKVTTNERGYGR